MPCHKLAEEMIIIHNIIIRGVNSIYLQCVNVETRAPESIPDFVDYVRMWAVLGERKRAPPPPPFAPGVTL